MTPATARYTIAVAASPIRLRRARAFQFSQNHQGRVNVMKTRQTLVPIQRVRSRGHPATAAKARRPPIVTRATANRMRPLDQLSMARGPRADPRLPAPGRPLHYGNREKPKAEQCERNGCKLQVSRIHRHSEQGGPPGPSAQAMTKRRAGTPTTSPSVFKKPATGFPTRTESTSSSGTEPLQLSQSGAWTKGTPEIESPSITTLCQRSA